MLGAGMLQVPIVLIILIVFLCGLSLSPFVERLEIRNMSASLHLFFATPGLLHPGSRNEALHVL